MKRAETAALLLGLGALWAVLGSALALLGQYVRYRTSTQ